MKQLNQTVYYNLGSTMYDKTHRTSKHTHEYPNIQIGIDTIDWWINKDSSLIQSI